MRFFVGKQINRKRRAKTDKPKRKKGKNKAYNRRKTNRGFSDQAGRKSRKKGN